MLLTQHTLGMHPEKDSAVFLAIDMCNVTLLRAVSDLLAQIQMPPTTGRTATNHYREEYQVILVWSGCSVYFQRTVSWLTNAGVMNFLIPCVCHWRGCRDGVAGNYLIGLSHCIVYLNPATRTRCTLSADEITLITLFWAYQKSI